MHHINEKNKSNGVGIRILYQKMPENKMELVLAWVLENKVKTSVEKGQVCIIMGDMKAPINESAKPFIKSAKKFLE